MLCSQPARSDAHAMSRRDKAWSRWSDMRRWQRPAAACATLPVGLETPSAPSHASVSRSSWFWVWRPDPPSMMILLFLHANNPWWLFSRLTSTSTQHENSSAWAPASQGTKSDQGHLPALACCADTGGRRGPGEELWETHAGAGTRLLLYFPAVEAQSPSSPRWWTRYRQ
jgi:hypothetical protein